MGLTTLVWLWHDKKNKQMMSARITWVYLLALICMYSGFVS